MTVSVYADPSGNYATMSIGGSEKFRLNSDGTATLGGVPIQRSLQFTPKLTNTGTSIEFSPVDSTGIPTWAKEIDITVAALSTNGVNNPTIQIGVGSYLTTGYGGAQTLLTNGVASGTTTEGIRLGGSGVASSRYGTVRLTSITNGSIKTWVATGVIGFADSPATSVLGETVDVTGSIDRLRLYAGGDTFDTGIVSVTVRG